MFGTSGIRGPVGDAVTAATALDVGRALAATGVECAVVGRDPRPSGRALADAVSVGLREGGSDVVRVGVAATPTVARSTGWLDADAGVAVTASHNPPTDNGLKLWNPDGRAFDGDQRREITRFVEDESVPLAPWDGHGRERTWDGATERHRDHLVDAHDRLDDRSVVVDVGNGAGRVTADALSALGCTVRTLDAQPDGSFPARDSEPTAASCDALARTVAATGADLGVAHDGDADRTLAVTADGEFVDGDRLLALFARTAVSPGDVVAVPVDTSLLVEDVVEDAGGEVRRTRVGDVHVANAAAESDAAFGGEPSGAWIWPDETLCPDGPFAACRLVALVDREGDLDTQLAAFDPYPIRRETIPTHRKEAVMAQVRDHADRSFERVDRRDGVRVERDDGWFLVRASGTEPVVRLTAEGRSADRADELLERARGVVARADPDGPRETTDGPEETTDGPTADE